VAKAGVRRGGARGGAFYRRPGGERPKPAGADEVHNGGNDGAHRWG
jgi:hypothetical protein